MRVTFGSGLTGAMSDLNAAAEALDKAERQVSSGKRIQTASDDPSAMAATIREHAEMAGIDQYSSASNNVDSRISLIDTVMSDVVTQLTTARSTAAASLGTVQTDTQREATARQLEGLRDAILTDMNTKFSGTYLFGGTNSLTPPYTKNADGTISAYAGNDTAMRVDIGSNRSIAVTYDGQSIMQGSDAEDLFTSFQKLIDAVRAGDQGGIKTGQTALESAFNRSVAAQSMVGADENAVADQQTRLTTMKTASKSRLSKDEDVNMAEAVTAMKQADSVYQYSLGAISSRTKLSLLDYLK